MFSGRFIGMIILAMTGSHLWGQDFSKVDAWLESNTPEMGGRAVLMIEKDGKIVYLQAARNG